MMKFLRFAPWLVLGPVTGLLLALCVAEFRAEHPIRAMVWVGLGVAFWTFAPLLLGAEVAFIRAAV